MSEKRLALLEQQLDERLDEVMGLQFAFMTLAYALDEQGALRLARLVQHLERAAQSLRDHPSEMPHDGLSPVAEQLDQLRASLMQPRERIRGKG